MKKFITSAMCLVLLSSCALAFGGCGEGEQKLYVEGDFAQKATAEEVSEVLSGLEQSTMFGDRDAEDWSLGIHMLGDVSLDLRVADRDGTSASLEMRGSSDYKVSYTKAEIGTDTRMSGTVDLNAETQVTEGDARFDVGMDVGGSAYLTEEAAYLDGSFSVSGAGMNVGVSGKYKLPIDWPTGSWRDAFDLYTVWSMVSGPLTAGYDAYIDPSGAETKIKVTLDLKETVLNPGSFPSTDSSELLELIDLVGDDSVLEIYSSVNKETGELVAFGMVVDAAIPETTEEDGESSRTVSMQLNASVWYLVEDVTADTPADPDSYFDIQGFVDAWTSEEDGTAFGRALRQIRR